MAAIWVAFFRSTAIYVADRCEAPGETGGYETGKPLKSFWLRHTQRGM